MKRLLLILSSLALSCVFMFFSPKFPIGFPYSAMVLTADTWFYFLFEHLILIILALAIVSEATEYRIALWAFVVIEVLDTLDYVLFYGEPWIEGIPTWNIFKVLGFITVIAYEVIKHKKPT